MVDSVAPAPARQHAANAPPPSLPPGAVLDHGPGFLERPAEIVIHGTVRDGERVPLLIFLPWTGGVSDQLYDMVSELVPLPGFVALLPQGQPGRSDYLPHFRDFVEAYEARVLADVERAISQFPVDATRVYTAGFSLGGDLGWALAMRNPERLRGALVIGSRCSYRSPRAALDTLRERDARLIFAIGRGDDALRVRGMERAHQRVEDAGLVTELARFSGGHTAPADPDEWRRLLSRLLGEGS